MMNINYWPVIAGVVSMVTVTISDAVAAIAADELLFLLFLNFVR